MCFYSAFMQSHDWNDLRFFLALFRSGKLVETGRITGVSDTTVARRVAALEEKLGTSLFHRTQTGRYAPTDAAFQILAHAERIELENTALCENLGAMARNLAGRVRISSVPIVVNRILVQHLPKLLDQHPNLTVELVPTSENLDLGNREADLAIRLARPATGGLRIRGQKLGDLKFSVYGAVTADEKDDAPTRWITYADTYFSIPQAKWLETMVARAGNIASPLQVTDAETALEAVAEGMGLSLLPCAAVRGDQRLRMMAPAGEAQPITREVWLLSHVDHSARSSVKAVKRWLTGINWDAT